MCKGTTFFGDMQIKMRNSQKKHENLHMSKKSSKFAPQIC